MPATSCCCGCSLRQGVRLICICNIVLSLYTMANSYNNGKFSDTMNQANLIGTALPILNVVFAILALSGMNPPNAQRIKVYFIYSLITTILGAAFAGYSLAIFVSQSDMDPQQQQAVEIFAGSQVVVALISIYYCYIIRSLYKDFQAGGDGEGGISQARVILVAGQGVVATQPPVYPGAPQPPVYPATTYNPAYPGASPAAQQPGANPVYAQAQPGAYPAAQAPPYNPAYTGAYPAVQQTQPQWPYSTGQTAAPLANPAAMGGWVQRGSVLRWQAQAVQPLPPPSAPGR